MDEQADDNDHLGYDDSSAEPDARTITSLSSGAAEPIPARRGGAIKSSP